MSEVPAMSHEGIEEYLKTRETILRLGTVDAEGWPAIHPVWYHYEGDRLYVYTDPNSRKARNATRTGRVYFSVDTNAEPYKGVKGRATASVVKDAKTALELSRKIVMKYLGGLDNDFGRSLTEGSVYVIEIAPEYYSVWNYPK